MLIVAAIWGINMAVMKLAIGEMDLFLFNAIRLTLSTIVLGIFTWRERHKPARQALVPPKNKVAFWFQVGVFSLLAGAIYQIVFAIGMSKTSAGNTALIMSSMPMWTALIAFVALKEKLGAAWAGLLLAFLGTIFVTLGKEGQEINLLNETLIGNLIILVAALAWSCSAVVSRSMLQYISPVRLAYYSTLGTLPVHIIAYQWLGGPSGFEAGNMWVWACILYSGLFSTGIAYAMWNFGVQQIGPSQAAVYQNLIPLIALIAAFFLLAERTSMLQLVGGGLIIGGLFLTRRLRPRPGPAAAVQKN